MPKKKRLKLNELKVKSFVTMDKDESGKIKGGNTWTICKTCGSECLATCGCTATVCTDCCPVTNTCNTDCGTCYTDCGTCLTCPPCNWTFERTCGPECSAITCY